MDAKVNRFKPLSASQKRHIARKIAKLSVAGAQLANLCYNLKQRPVGYALDDRDLMSMRGCQENWDRARKELPPWIK